jgi:hypothetical protein
MCRKDMSRLLVVVGLVTGYVGMAMLVTLTTGCGSTDSSNKPLVRLATYTNADYGLSVEHPDGWSAHIDPAALMTGRPHLDFTILWEKPASGSQIPSQMAVAVFYWRNRLSAAQRKSLLQATLRLYRSEIGLSDVPSDKSDTMRIRRVELVHLKGGPAVFIHEEDNVTPGLESDEYFLTRQGVMYSMAFMGPRSDFTTVFRGLPQTLSTNH